MFRLVLVLNRRGDLSEASFTEGWCDARRSGRRPAGLLRSVLDVPTPGLMPVESAPRSRFDGIEEMWFDRRTSAVAHLEQLARDNDGNTGWRELLDPAPVTALGGDTSVLFNAEVAGGPDAPKLLILAARRPGLTTAEFRKLWIDGHGPLALASPGAREQLRRLEYTPADPLPDSSVQPAPFDGVGTIQFRSVAHLQQSFGGDYYRDVLAPDETRFADPERSAGSPVREVSLVDGPEQRLRWSACDAGAG